MRTRFLVPVAIVAALFLPAAMPTTVVQAQSVDEQRQRVEDIVDELERLEERARILGEDYVEAIDTKGQLEAEITDAEARIAEQEAELAELRSSLSEMALRSFVGGGGAPLGPLFEDTEHLNDALKRDELARAALSAGNVTTDEIDELVDDIEDERADLERKREQAEQLAASLTEAQAETERLTNEYTQARAEAEATLGRLLREEEERRARESARRLQEQAAQIQAQAEAETRNAGGSRSGGSSESSSGGSSSGGSSSGGSSGGGSAPAPSGGGSSGGGSSGGGSSSGSGGSGGGYSAPAVSSRAGIAVQAALGQQGVPYRYATSTPGVGFDCSGLTSYAWAQAGVGLPRNSRSQFAATPRVSPSQAQPGDLIFFYNPVSHVSIYLGGGQHIHAPNTGSTVRIDTVNWSRVTGVGRPG